VAEREARSAEPPPWEQGGSDGPERIALAVLAVVIVCALLGGIAVFATTLGGSTASPSPAASIAPTGSTPPAGPAGTAVSGASGKPTVKPSSTIRAGHGAGHPARRRQAERAARHRSGRRLVQRPRRSRP
jgi:hypothetical protein